MGDVGKISEGNKVMSKIIDALKASENLRAGGSAETSDIDRAEKTLELTFAEEYKDYLKEFGFASYKGHELTGICESSRLNVVDVTLEAREIYNVNFDMYVIEDTGYEGILILQNRKGEVFQIQPLALPEKISESLSNYIQGK